MKKNLSIEELASLGKTCLESVGLSYDVNLKGSKIVYVVKTEGIDAKIVKIVPTKKHKVAIPNGMITKARKIFKNNADALMLYTLIQRVQALLKKVDFTMLNPEQKALLNYGGTTIGKLEDKK